MLHTGGYYRAINLSGNTAEIKNNIFVSAEATHTNTSFISAVPTPASDNNVFYIKQPHTGATVVGTYTTLGEYQSANSTKDANSKSVDVTFENAATGDLRIAAASYQDANLQVVRLTDVPKDLFGTDRDYYTYAGAHQAQAFIINENATPEVSARIMRTMSGIEVQLDSEATVELYNMNGMIIDKVVTSGTYSHDLDNGVYIIRINGKATKFIK